LDARYIPASQQPYFAKRLRFYLDFFAKYGFEPYDPQSLPYFIQKLQSKNQGHFQQQLPTEAVHISLEISSAENANPEEDPHSNFSRVQVTEAKSTFHNPSAVQVADERPDAGFAQVGELRHLWMRSRGDSALESSI